MRFASDGSSAPPASRLPPHRPANGGQDCPGVNYEYQLCNTDDCPKHFEDFRAQQCQLRNSHFEFQSAKHHWLPYEHPDGELALRHFLVARCQLTAVFCLDSRSRREALSDFVLFFQLCDAGTVGEELYRVSAGVLLMAEL